MPLLQVEHLSVKLQTQRGPAYAVRDASFSLERGETLGLVGGIGVRQVDHGDGAAGAAAREGAR